jgi:hypothetical protein
VAEDPPTNNYATQVETPARQDVDVLLDVSELEVDRINLTVRNLSLRFNHEGFCDGHKAHHKTPRVRPLRALRQQF